MTRIQPVVPPAPIKELWDNSKRAERYAPARRYTPLVPRPEGGADQIMVAHESQSATPVLFGTAPTEQVPRDVHWFVPDDTGTYCLACNLPRANRRHVARGA